MRNILTIIFLFFFLTLNAKTTQTRLSFGNIIQTVFLGNNLSWSQNSTWNNGIPTNGDTVIVLLPTNFNTTIETIANLEIRSNLNIPNGNTLKITNELKLISNDIIVGGNLIIVGDSVNYGRVSEVNNGNIIGDFIYEKWVERCNNWSLYGGPFDATLNEYSDSSNNKMVYTGFPNSHYPNFGTYPNAYFWDENHIGTGGWIIPDGNYTIPRGVGFWYWNSDTVFNSPNPQITQKWKVATKGSIDFNSNFIFPIQYTNSGDINLDGWNLVANPYPGIIDWDNPNLNRTNIEDAIHVLNTCNQTYASYVGGVGVNGGTRFISPFQGFYVKANNANPSLTSNGRVISRNNSDLLRLSNNINNILRLNFNGDEIVIRINNDADGGFNSSFDAHKMMGDSSFIYSELDSIMYSINSVNDSVNEIPIYTLGGGVIHFSDLNTWESKYNLYFEDLKLGTITKIDSLGGFYSFSDTSVNFINRFVIHISIKTTTNIVENKKEIGLKTMYYKDDVILKLSHNKPVLVDVYNMVGQLISSKKTILTNDGYRIKRLNQILIVRIYNNEIDVVTKIF